MAVQRCYLCEENPIEGRRYGGDGLAQGGDCPICYRPTCRFHLTVVRWRWREDGRRDSALICKECRRTYAHRNWDAVHRDWIT